MKPSQRNVITFTVALIFPFLAAALGGLATASSVKSWYPTLKKPAWNPPAWLFGPVWSLLYGLMGLASWLVWQQRPQNKAAVDSALKFYGVQLLLNTLWSILFFGLRRVDLALAEIAFLWSAIAGTVISFQRIRPVAALLMLPYLLWTTFAAALNATVWWLNRN